MPSFWMMQGLGWLVYWAAMSTSRIGRFPASYMLASKGLLALTGFAITAFLLRPIYRRLLRTDPALPRIIVVTAICSYVAALLWTAADNVGDIPFAGALLGRDVHLTSMGQVFGGALYNAFTLLAWSVLYVGAKQYHDLHQERERVLRAEALAHEARLEALRYQLNPHFLFNALNAVSTLVTERRNDEATRMIARLGDLLRATLDRSDGETIALTEELELVRRYLDIEQVRLGDRLRVTLDIDANAWTARIPPMLLQPLVENAIKHAVAPRESGGVISISARKDGARLHLAIADDGPGVRGDTTTRGIGLANARARLGQLYGESHQFSLGASDAGGLRVDVTIPAAGPA